jgi:hypothetical protein
MKKVFSILMVALMAISIMGFTGCSDAEVASSNISQAADQFEIYRRVVFYNGITDTYILMVEGYCSVLHDTDGDINIMVKTGPGQYVKHMLGPSDNVTWFAEQIESKNVSTGQYRVVFKPSVIIPTIDLE